MSSRPLKIYIAGKVARDSVFGTHYWRDNFCAALERLSGRAITSLDPTKVNADQAKPEEVFGCDSIMIAKSDGVVVYLTDDISVGASQEILIAKYYHKPVIALAPHGGKFNGSSKEYFGKTIHNYKDPFVFSTCDIVCSTIEEVAESIKTFETIKPKNIDVIKTLADEYQKERLNKNEYLIKLELDN